MAYTGLIDDVAVKTFGDSIRHAFGQAQSKLMSCVTYDGMVGEELSIDFIGAVDPQLRVARNQATVVQDFTFDRRWVVPATYEFATVAEERDMARMLANPRPAMIEEIKRGFYRKADEIIIAAFDAAAKIGKAGASTASYVTTYDVAVNYSGSNENMTLDKLAQAAANLQLQDVDFDYEQVYFLLHSKSKGALLQDDQLKSSDFVTQSVLQTGKIPMLYGMQPVVSNKTGVDGSSYRKCFVWAKSAMEFRMLQPLQLIVNQRADLNNAWQLYMRADFGAVRTQEAGVLKILCAES